MHADYAEPLLVVSGEYEILISRENDRPRAFKIKHLMMEGSRLDMLSIFTSSMSVMEERSLCDFFRFLEWLTVAVRQRSGRSCQSDQV